jgi:hypothetical protein
MCGEIVKLWLRHSRANRTLDILNSYAEKGKDPPPELLAALQNRHDVHEHRDGGHVYSWTPFFLFSSLAVAFCVMAFVPNDMAEGHELAFVFVAIIMVGLALGSLVTVLTKRRLDERTRNKPQ